MDDLDRAVTETLQRVNQFGIENAAELEVNAKAVGCFAAIELAVNELEARGVARSSSNDAKFNATELRAVKRHTFSQMVSKIAATARDIARHEEGFENKFRVPRRDRSDLVWLEAGRAFANDLPAVKTKFIEYGYQPDFIDKLIAAADGFEAAMNAQNAYLRQRVDANATIDSILDEALESLRTLKIIIPNIFSGNPGKLADWASASHVERRPQPAATPPA